MAEKPTYQELLKKIENLKRFGLLYEDDKILKLTNLGAFFADEVCHQFHHAKYMPFPESEYNDGELNPYRYPEP